jgi:integrase
MTDTIPVVPARTGATEAAYNRRVTQIIARIRRERRSDPPRRLRPDDLLAWLDGKVPSLAHSSWRQYKAAISALVTKKAESDPLWLPVLDQIAAMRWSSSDKPPKTHLPLRTSARKAKSAPMEKLEALRTRLATHNPAAAEFLLAAYSTGLRPVEWAGATFDRVGHRWRLKVRNAKATNGRSHGHFRTLWFDEIDCTLIDAIRKTICRFKEAAARNAVAALQEKTERAFRRANEALWPRRTRSITPYTLRHLFAARLKAAYPSEEVAAIMGHAVDVTAYEHYGRPPRSNSGPSEKSLPKADPEDVARVRRVRETGLEWLATADPSGHRP